jgi:ubiquitin C-terminal hydrolase
VRTPLQEPQDEEEAWRGKDLRAVLAHSGETGSGHWVTYVKRNTVWLSMDTARGIVSQENPFEKQNSLTIGMLMFKE